MKTILSFLMLFSLQSFADTNPCDVYKEKLEKEFNAKEGEPIHLKDSNDYEKMKKVIQEIPLASSTFAPYLKQINDETYEVSDLTNLSNIYRETCLFVEFKGIDALTRFVEKNKNDKKLVGDLHQFLLPRILVIKDVPVLVPLLIKMTYLKYLVDFKHGGKSALYKELDQIHKNASEESRRLNSESLKLYPKNHKKDSDLTKEQIKPLVTLQREEAKVSKKYSDQFFELISKI